MQIAIDGPAGSGKSSIARKLAQRKGYIHIDSGACYRALAFYATARGVDLHNEEAVCNALATFSLSFEFKNGIQHTILTSDGRRDISRDIRSAEAGAGASIVARYDEVRKRLVDIQRDLAHNKDVVMDGRDIGTVVLPQADVKIFLDADVDIRVQRRVNELKRLGIDASFADIKAQLAKRDHDDANRPNSPTAAAADAITLDVSHKSIDTIVEEILTFVKT